LGGMVEGPAERGRKTRAQSRRGGRCTGAVTFCHSPSVKTT